MINHSFLADKLGTIRFWHKIISERIYLLI